MTDSDDLKRVSQQVAGRLEARGVHLTGHESADELTLIEEALVRFELAVQSQGGDLMMDEPPPGHDAEPDDVHFALPKRRDHEPVAAYVDRLEHATDRVRHHGQRGSE